ncbi:hypothetical protein ACFRMQ_30415 [Kitasatospora sp. NPDC056783]|uniref:hypothetical protein n=1 Tax=Kitasatospora sp. NPDC056783 TaxID=3345943 RepID=UPI003675AED3
MAAPGYGKQSAPEQLPRSANDFAHLPAREAYLASLIDRLPDGAAMDVKTLAALQPHYGQMACRTALNNLSAAGHLRRVRERLSSKDCRWVFHTHFSRTPRSDAWWAHFIATGGDHNSDGGSGDASTPAAPDPPEERTPNRTHHPNRRPASSNAPPAVPPAAPTPSSAASAAPAEAPPRPHHHPAKASPRPPCAATPPESAKPWPHPRDREYSQAST